MITSVLNYLGRNVIRIFTFCCLLLLTSLGYSQAKIIFQDDYETYNLSKWSWRDLPFTNSMVQSTDYPRAGSQFCNKITLNKTDPLVSGNHRAELVWNANAYNTQTNTGVQWIAYSVLLPPSWINDVNHPESIVNIHDGEACANSGTNPQALSIGGKNGDRFVYWVYYSTVPYCQGGSNQLVTGATRQFDLGPIQKGVWIDFIIHSNWSAGDDGYVQVWMNGTQVLDYKGKCWFAGTFTEPYIKFGDYKYSWANETAWGGNSLASTRVFYNDNIKIGSKTATLSDFLTTAGPPPANQAPTANAGSNVTVTLPTSTSNLNGSASADPDGSISKYAWTQASGPNTATIANAGTANTALSNLVQGTYNFTLTVTDNGGATATDQVTVTVNAAAVNKAPVADAGSNMSVMLPTNTANVNGSSSVDPDGSISKYAWSEVSGPSTCAFANAAAATTSVSGLAQGQYALKLTVTDNLGMSDADTVMVTVNAPPVNQAPSANAGANISITQPTTTAALSGSGTDPDGSISKYAWTQASGPNTATIANAAAASTNLSNLVPGTYTFNLTVTDNGGKTATDAVSVTVNAAAVNQAPSANAGANISITQPTTTAALNGSGTDPDGSISKYAWTQASGPNTATIANAAAASTTLSNLVPGTYTFNLTVTDNGGKTATDAMTITVTAVAVNQPPSANAGANISITQPTTTAALNGSGSDPDGSISKYAWTQASGPNTATIANAAAAGTNLSNLVPGTYTFNLTVTDNGGKTASDVVTVTVNAATAPVNKVPVSVPGQDKTIVLPTTSTNLNGTSSYDPDGNIVSFAWSQSSGPTASTIGAPASASTNVSNLAQQGVYTFKLTVTDNQGGVGVDFISVTVNPAPAAPNQAPLANAGVNLTVVLPTNTVTLNGSGSSDPDGSIASYAWSQLKGPNSANIGFPNSTNSGVSGLIEGNYTFNLVVTDNKGMSSSDTVHVTVNPQPAPGPNQAPVANSGGSKAVTLPTTSVLLNGASSYDPDGSIASYSWKQISGPTQATIQTPAGSSTGIYNMAVGVYEFELTVTDNKGLAATDRSVVTVSNATAPAPPANVAQPVAVANDTIVITLPVQNTSLDGTKSYDSAGSVVAYSWAYVSGPSAAVLDNTDQAIALAKDLVVGTYVFQLTVTDNQGATDAKNVTVLVLNSATRPQVSTVAYYPNPAHWKTTLKVEGSTRGKATLQIYNSAGAMVSSQTLYIDQQTFTKDIYLRGYAKGVYYMNLRIGSDKPVVRKLQKL